MKNYIRLFLLAAVIILSVTALVAQTKDIVYLKNGSVIKGTILEMIPDKTIKIQTADGNIFVYKMSEVEKVGKDVAAPSNEPKPAIEQRPSNEGQQRSYEGQRAYEGQRSSEGAAPAFSFFGGIALPVGDLAKKEGDNAGSAKLGWTAGAQFVTGGSVGFIIEGSFSQNKLDLGSDLQAGRWEYTSYTTILGLAGLKIGTDNSNGTNFFIAPLAGVLSEKTPEVTFTRTGATTSTTYMYSGSATAFAYGGVVEAIVGGHVTLSGTFIASKPKFKYSVNGHDYESDPYNWSLVLVTLGLAF
jgi:hypothetical protein